MKNDYLVSLIDGICQRYGQRPSNMIGLLDDKVAFDFDAAIAIKASQFEKDEMEKSKNESPQTSNKMESQVRNAQNMQRKAALVDFKG